MRRFALILFLLPGIASANELLRVYELATRNDTQLRAAMHQRDAAMEAQPQARAALLPQLTGQGTYAWDDTTNKDASFCKGAIQIPSADCQTRSEPYALTINLSQALFNVELWSRMRQSDRQAALALTNYRNAEQRLILRATEAYFNVLAASDSVRLASAEQRSVERQLELAKKRFEVGLSAITDVQEAQARYDLTVAQLIEAEQALASAKEALAEITNQSQVGLVPLREEIPLEGPNPDSVDDWLKTAAEQNFELEGSRLQAEIAERGVSVSRSGHLPTLSLNAYQSVGESAGFDPNEFESSRVTLQLDVPIFAGGATQSAVSQAKATHEQRLAELEGTRRRVERQVRDAYQGVIAGVARVKALNQAVISNTTALEASEVGLEVGARTAVDVLNAQRELYRAQRDYARARYDYLLNVLRLKIAAGQLTRKDLSEIDGLLVQPLGDPPAG